MPIPAVADPEKAVRRALTCCLIQINVVRVSAPEDGVAGNCCPVLRGNFMKYMIEYTVRTEGLSFDENFAGSEALLTAFSKWKPDDEKGLTILAFLSNLTGRGGYILLETNDPKTVTTFASKYNYWNDVSIVPVVDIGETVPIVASSLEWAKRASKA
jgi:Domain of unknown function (DUF3303)